MGDAAGELLGEALKDRTALTALDIRMGLSDAAGVALCKALQSNATVNQLNLCCSLTDALVAALGQALKGNTALTALAIDNEIFARTARGVALAERWQGMRYADLERRTIGEAAVVKLAEALKTNTALGKLELHGISPVAALALANQLNTNTSLTSLHLTILHCGDEAMADLVKALRSNPAEQLVIEIDNLDYSPHEAKIQKAFAQLKRQERNSKARTDELSKEREDDFEEKVKRTTKEVTRAIFFLTVVLPIVVAAVLVRGLGWDLE